MRHLIAIVLSAATMLPAPALAGGTSRVYLVPAIKECPGPSTCPREFESSYTFDSIVLRTPASKFAPTGKPSLTVDVRGVRDASGAAVTGNLTVRLLSGRVSLPTLGTFPDDSSLTRTAPITLELKNGSGKVSYKAPTTPNGLITNGGGVEVFDPAGKRFAVTGTQTKP